MSLRYEQQYSLYSTRKFLQDILTCRDKWTKKELRARAAACLRHYPPLGKDGSPMFSEDDFECKPIEDNA